MNRRSFLRRGIWLLSAPAIFIPKARAQFNPLTDMPFLSPRATAAAGGVGNPLITSQTLGTLRSNFTGEVGFSFVPNATKTITQLGRWVVSGNSLTHTLKVYLGNGTVLGSVVVNCSGATAGQYLYGDLTPNLTFSSGTTYFIQSTEVSGGDQWYDGDTVLTGINSGLCASVTSISRSVTHSTDLGNTAKSYVPVNLKFR